MPDISDRIELAISNLWQGQATEAEIEELKQWLQDNPDNLTWLRQFEDDDWVGARVADFQKINIEKGKEKLWAQMDALPDHRKRIRLYYWLGAAAVLICIVITIYLWPTTRKQVVHNTNLTKVDSVRKTWEDTCEVVLETAAGRQYALQREPDRVLTEQGDFALIKKGHRLIIKKLTPAGRVPVFGYHRLSTPGGGKYEVTLPDGSSIWLNAGSSISIPAADTGQHRYVTLIGEAYFEIGNNTGRSLVVNIPGASALEVLGTIFNITAYPGDPVTKTTMVEGAVSIEINNHKKQIKQGQQAQVSAGGITVSNNVNVKQITAWKNGRFDFRGDNPTAVLGELARWYNLKIRYLDTPTVPVLYQNPRSLPVDSTLSYINAGKRQLNVTRQKDTLIVRR